MRSATSDGPPIRIVLVETPAMISVIVRDAIANSDIEIVEEVVDGRDIPAVLKREPVDVVIAPTDRSGVAHQYHDLLQWNPLLKVLTIAAVARSTDLYELRLLGANVGRAGVIAAIQAVMGRTTRR